MKASLLICSYISKLLSQLQEPTMWTNYTCTRTQVLKAQVCHQTRISKTSPFSDLLLQISSLRDSSSMWTNCSTLALELESQKTQDASLQNSLKNMLTNENVSKIMLNANCLLSIVSIWFLTFQSLVNLLLAIISQINIVDLQTVKIKNQFIATSTKINFLFWPLAT